MKLPFVLDTNALVAAFISADGASRQLLRSVLTGLCTPIISVALFTEYEDVLSRDALMAKCPLTPSERDSLFDAFLSRTHMIEVYYSWRPNLRDEADNHVVETAVAAGVVPIVTFNLRDFNNPQLRFLDLQIITPAKWLAQLKDKG
jgi:putative PIN family toxin of toxin-antitoxin system